MNNHNIKNDVKNAVRAILSPTDALNKQLKAIEHATKANWDNYAKLREIKTALRSRNNYLKEQTIKKLSTV